jgi:hypothetical protein
MFSVGARGSNMIFILSEKLDDFTGREAAVFTTSQKNSKSLFI